MVSFFRFNVDWLLKDNFEDQIKIGWAEGDVPLLEKLEQLGNHLKNWVKTIQGKRGKKKKELTEQLERLNEEDPEESILAKITEVKLTLNLEADKEKLYWAQRARSSWLKHGDRNTSYFHRLATQKQKKKTINKLEDESGVKIEGEENLQTLATKYFQELFTTNPIQDNSILMNRMEPCVEMYHNEALTKKLLAEEVYDVIKIMASLKAVGNDGFPAFFFQKYWHLVGNDIVRYCLDVLNEGKIFDAINKANIVLIPKVSDLKNMGQYKPISLCTVIYKIISRVLVNRFRKVLEIYVDETQGAFVPGRQITDNILITYEVLHSLKKKRGGRTGYFALKLDMSKIYD